MQNGYALLSKEGAATIHDILETSSLEHLDEYRETLRIGIQTNAQVTLGGHNQAENPSPHVVTQVFCSALPIAYMQMESISSLEAFARLVLEASYEATFWAALENVHVHGGSNKLFLTLLGGGAFGNPLEWVLEAIRRCLEKFSHCDLEVILVSYGGRTGSVDGMIQEFYDVHAPLAQVVTSTT